jgi:photosystem II stability/assembly factor-like uncharacterized protein
LFFLDPQTGWSLGAEIHRTQDGGLTWSQLSTVNWQAQFNFVSQQVGWAVARSDEQLALVQTVDGGQIWSLLNPLSVP